MIPTENVPIGTDLAQAAAALYNGGLVAVPTETVYGLGANGLNLQAVQNIFAAKGRPSFNPLILHVADVAAAQALTTEWPAAAQRLAQQFWPGPLTLVLSASAVVPDVVRAGLPTVAVRVPRHTLTLQLLAQLPFPLAAPSANPSGFTSPTTAQHVASQLGHHVDYILDGGPCAVGLESTIVRPEADRIVLLRPGVIGAEALEAATGLPVVRPDSLTRAEAPGMLRRHYATRTPLLRGTWEACWTQHTGKKLGAIVFQHLIPSIPAERQWVLAPDGQLETAAERLYAGLHHMDTLSLDAIWAETLTGGHHLTAALNDRLDRAAAPPDQAYELG